VAQTVVLALQMTLLRFCRMPEFKSARRRLLPDVQYDTLTAELISEIMPLEGSSAAQLEQLAAWVERRMPFLRLSLAGAEDLRVMEDGARHIVIFALVGEFLTNALKFTGTGGAISLSVTRTDTGLELACRNPVDTEMPRPLLSGKTGLDFVRKVCQLVAARFDEPAVDGGAFSVHAVLPIQ
jgi:signal transduction histidine kinase